MKLMNTWRENHSRGHLVNVYYLSEVPCDVQKITQLLVKLKKIQFFSEPQQQFEAESDSQFGFITCTHLMAKGKKNPAYVAGCLLYELYLKYKLYRVSQVSESESPKQRKNNNCKYISHRSKLYKHMY